MPYNRREHRSRRFVIFGAASFAAAAAATPIAAAETGGVLKLPCSIAYMRFSRSGAEPITQGDRKDWEHMARRLGGLVQRIEPFSHSQLLPATAPIADGGAAAALQARMTASRAGYGYILIYAVLPPELTEDEKAAQDRMEPEFQPPGRKHVKSKWLFKNASTGRIDLTGPDYDAEASAQFQGEAHLIDAASGNVVLSSWASAPPNKSVGVFRKKRDPEAEIREMLIQVTERKLQLLARDGYRNGRSIAG